MNIIDILPELSSIRRRLHQFPEIGLSEVETPRLIAQCLQDWGLEVHRNIGKTGIVACLRGGTSSRSIGLRADFDALPILEETGLPYSSKQSGVMHACGHDGHVAMLLGAARLLSENRDFDGCINFIFQPAEENFGGAKLMLEDGLLERFPCDRVFALHNLPGLPAGVFATRPGAIAASVDVVKIVVTGQGGHGAMPAKTIDPIVAGASIVTALQTIVSRNVEASAVITVGAFNAGITSTIIPDSAELKVSIRALGPDVRAELCARVEQIASMQAGSFGAKTAFEWDLGYPATINDGGATSFAKNVIVKRFGDSKFRELDAAKMFSEDFSFILEHVPGAYVLIGNGDSAPLHSSTYDFNEALLGPGALYFHDLAVDYLVTQRTGSY